ncbi:FGGY family carbohydrate kinase [Cryobacterium sp. M91]|uniref:FGGY family carbohydrate kinase n=1 Tax=Cryobacterium sp. M91 TaxID=2048294 RepID=UPI000CE41497|nr:FGGY family carbohydrate kinase [Cryobacterium sp. M91]
MSPSTKIVLPAIVAVDQGTSSTKTIVVDGEGRILSRASVKVSRVDARPGWVEQDAEEIRSSVISSITAALAGLDGDVDIRGIGLSNQRESAVVWDRETGKALGPMLGWQDRRTASRVAEYEDLGWGDIVRHKTGLPLDPMFSALKIQWLLDQIDPDRTASMAGRIAVGTVDSWLVHSLTGEHRIELGNASRTQLLNLESASWDLELLELFQIPLRCMPRLAASSEPTGPIVGVPVLPADTRIYAVLGDSHAALFAHGVRGPGQVKATHGSGSSVMGLLQPGAPDPADRRGLVRTIAWATPDPVYAFEGTILSTGATLLWLGQLLGMGPGQLSAIAQTVSTSQGVDLVPAFAGLGAPYWDEKAVAVICGFGLGTKPAELARAAFESVALQTEALFEAVEQLLGARIETVLTDGGPSQNDWLMQLQADFSQRDVIRSNIAELSATGAAHLAGISSGLWSADECARLPRETSVFLPGMDPVQSLVRRERWRSAVARSRGRSADYLPSDEEKNSS